MPEHFSSSWENQDRNILQPSNKVESQCQKKKNPSLEELINNSDRKVKEDCKEYHNEELHDFYFSQNITQIIKS